MEENVKCDFTFHQGMQNIPFAQFANSLNNQKPLMSTTYMKCLLVPNIRLIED
jgi:hypothetical protein